jgi:hypothetical protein
MADAAALADRIIAPALPQEIRATVVADAPAHM